MLSEFEYSGLFWAPANPEKRIPGVLKYTPGGRFELHIIQESSMDDDFNQMNRSLESLPVWHGAIIGKGHVTLYQLIQTGSNYAPGLLGLQSAEQYRKTIAKITYAAQFLIWGALIEDWDEPFFDYLSIQPTDIEFWEDQFRYTFGEHFEDKKQTIEIPTSFPEVKAELYQLESQLEIQSAAWFQSQHPRSKEQSTDPDNLLFHRTFVRLKPTQLQSMEWYLDALEKLSRFFALCLNRAVFFREIAGIVELENGRKQVCEIMFQQLGLPQRELGFPKERYVSLPDITGNLSSVLNTYIETHNQDYEPIYELFVSSHYFQDTSTFNRFLNLCQGLESFHRLQSGKSKMIFLKRFKELFNSIDASFLSISNVDYFCEIIKDTRNYYTHYGKKEKRILNASEMHIANIQLKSALAMVIFKHLGVSEDILKENIKKSRVLNLLMFNPDLVI